MAIASEGRSDGSRLGGLLRWVGDMAPGIGLCFAISIASFGLQVLEVRLLGHPFIEALVIAILLGIVVRLVWTPGKQWQPGISFSSKTLLEIAVMLLGASITAGALMTTGPSLLLGVLLTVAVAIIASYFISRALGLEQRISILIACGNSICGNSAIVAVAPVIGASKEDIASSIAFTAVLGVIVVLTLPLLIPVLGLAEVQYGVLAGLTVYAVPQVLAATMPVGLIATQFGTLVKLARVLMLAPVVIFFSVYGSRFGLRSENGAPRKSILKLIPWFIIGFILFAILRSTGLIPDHVAVISAEAATFLTVLSMAALGLGVDVRVLGQVGGRVTTAVVASLIVLGAISYMLILLLGIA